ncbi:MAG: DUF429 domain-containing protein [Flavobacteriales bacterium]|nr:DUF429 domain-containing protein [Flavobacteriales bacterium]
MSLQYMRIWGIDYGSKLAGTTVVATLSQDASPEAKVVAAKPQAATLHTSQRKKDADRMILKLAEQERPDLIFIDAPLSLPGAYFGTDDDFFYRPVDREVGAMSPMFLGGLTARAMQVKVNLERLLPEIQIYESYPKLRAKDLGFTDRGYKKEVKHIEVLFAELKDYHHELKFVTQVGTWHHLDALLALSSALRFTAGEHDVYGPEGGACIYV